METKSSEQDVIEKLVEKIQTNKLSDETLKSQLKPLLEQFDNIIPEPIKSDSAQKSLENINNDQQENILFDFMGKLFKS